jgi:Fe-S-cluster-containing hydrogenase component 2
LGYKRIRFEETLCSGCKICELVCSLVHEGECNPSFSRIKIISFEFVRRFAIFCVRCLEAKCIEICPQNANYRDQVSGAILTDHSKCKSCGLCAKQCPHEAIFLSKTGGIFRCDLCGGDPHCVGFCPTGALSFA